MERRLVEAENSLSKNNEELYKSLLDVQNLIEENEKLKNEIDELQSKNEKLKNWNQELIIENNNLKNENDNLVNKQKGKIDSEKIQVKPSFIPKAIDHNKIISTNKIENKNITITNKEIKSFLDECKKRYVKEIQGLLLRLKEIDETKVDTKLWRSLKKDRQNIRNQQKYSRNSRRENCSLQIRNKATELHYKISWKLKNLPEDNSTIQYRKILNSVDQYLKIVIDCCKIHTQLTTKAEMDTYTYNALKAVETINSIIDNF
ncbi:MAG: hypothetical protein IJU61_06355 [Victivallales bacterium]|nr:hypothetical protein [Victivallales bacterium]